MLSDGAGGDQPYMAMESGGVDTDYYVGVDVGG